MSPLKLAIVTGRFWPYFGISEMCVAELAAAIRRAGHEVEIITVRWDRNWPRNLTFREIDVLRISRPASGTWGAYRFLRGLTRHINDSDFDGMIVFGTGPEAWATIRSVSKQIPVLMRIARRDLIPHAHEPLQSKQWSAIESVRKVLVDSEWTLQQLAGPQPTRLAQFQVVPDAVEFDGTFRRSTASQAAVRLALSDAHPVLSIEPSQPLVICGAPLDGDAGVCDLVDAWPRVLNRFSNARLWIIGDGFKGHQVWDRIVDGSLTDSIIMPGFFDDLTDLFQAADLYVHPLREDAPCGCLTKAMAAGLCPVVTETMATRNQVEPEVSGVLVSKGKPRALAESIIHALGDADLRRRLGAAAQTSATKKFNIEKLAMRYLEHFYAPADRAVPVVK